MKRCLLVEDDLDDQEIFCLALQEVGKEIECVFAKDGFEALTILQQNQSGPLNPIFIDVNLPRMNGLVCLQEIRRKFPDKNIKIIIYSTSSEGSVISDSKALGADDFLVKPTSLTLLVEKLREIFYGENYS